MKRISKLKKQKAQRNNFFTYVIILWIISLITLGFVAAIAYEDIARQVQEDGLEKK